MASTTLKIALGVGCGIVLGVGALFVACTGCVAMVGHGMNEAKAKKSSALSHIEFEDVQGSRDGGYVKVRGKVRNNGPESVDFVKVQVDILDSSKKVIDTDSTYAVSSEGLAPGAAKSFEVMVRADDRMDSFKYHIVHN